ncbi:MAG: FG-GAP repeat protein [Desulfobacterales bacterium]
MGTTWSQVAKLTATDGAADDRFGFSVSIMN